MRTLLLFAILPLGLLGQSPYQLFRPGVQYLYENPGFAIFPTTATQFYGVRVDSSDCSELYTTFGYGDSSLPSDCVFRRPAPFGDTVCQNADSTVMDYGDYGRVVLYQNAPLDSSWTIRTTSDREITATVTEVAVDTFLGLSDTVKTITLTASPDAEEQGATPIRISRRYGLVGGLRFYTFPLPGNELPLAAIHPPSAGMRLPPPEVYGLAAVGDTFQVEIIGRYAFGLLGAGSGEYGRLATVVVQSVDSSQTDVYTYEMRGDIYDLGPAGADTVALDTTFSYSFSRLPESLATTQPGTVVVDSSREATTRFLHRAFLGPGGVLQRQRSTGVGFASDSTCGFDLAGLDESPGPAYTPYIPFSLSVFGTVGGPQGVRLLYYRSGDRRIGKLRTLDEIVSVDHPKRESLRIQLYPNPVGDRLTIEVPESNGAYRFEVWDQNGRRLGSYPTTTTETVVNVGDLSRGGYYLIALREGRVVGRKRFIKR
jgi:hypothetical protein